MPRVRPFCTLLTCLFLASSISSQTTNPSPPQASSLLQSSYQALSGSTTVNDVTLTGTVERIAGSDDETGSAKYEAVAGASRMDLNLSEGSESEIRALGADAPAGNWIGHDAAAHEIPYHNLLTDAGWFPIFTLANLISETNGVLTYVGPETKNGASVLHIIASRQFPGVPAKSAPLWQHLTQIDIYLDASTLLPVALDFDTHPDDNSSLDIPVEFRFSDNRSVGQLTIPFHVQKYLNGSLLLDVQFQTATINSGLSSSSSTFAIQ